MCVKKEVQVKVSSVNNISSRSHFQATATATATTTNPVTQKEANFEKSRALIALGVLGVASIALYALNSKSAETIKKAVKPTVKKVKTNFSKKVPSKRRGQEALRQYQYELNLRKLESLHTRILNNEFDGKTRLAMEQIQRNHIQLAKAVGCLKI